MTEATAQRINSAACHAWLFERGVSERLAFADIEVINSVSVAQIQTAVDFVNAANAAARPVNGWRPIRCTLDPDAADRIKRYVATLSTTDSE